MAGLVQGQVGAPHNLRKLLAVAVRSIQWSYAVFWSISSKQEGALEWTDGYYNGDIKTRKTVQAIELKADKAGLQRSEQLRELYESLLDGEIEQQAKRPSAALSPEDLSDAEWYYLVCMSFVFNIGEDLAGKALANRQTVWLCNAQYADSKVFSRSLLAKSASVQTVICFPYLDGVIELGVTDLVMEDHDLIQHIKASLLDISKPVCSKKSSSAPHSRDDGENPIPIEVDNERADALVLENRLSSTVVMKVDKEVTNQLHGNMHEELEMDSLDDCSNCCEHNHQSEDSFVLPGASQVQSWRFMDDYFSNGCVPGSLNSADCISEAFVNLDKARVSPMKKNTNHVALKELQEGNDTKLNSLDLGADDDLHFKRILSAITSNNDQFIQDPRFRGSDRKSSFVSWNKGGVVEVHGLRVHQSTLKKVLFSVPLMHSCASLRSNNENGEKECTRKVDSNQLCRENDLSDKQIEDEKFVVLGSMVPSVSGLCKKRDNENFRVLKSMVPAISETDKALMLDDMIKYLKDLEARVEELESCTDSVDYEAKPKRNFMEMLEQISDNYENKKTITCKKPWINKRKASDIDGTDTEPDGVVAEDGPPLHVNVSMKENEVVVEMSCPYREYILLDIMDEINKLHLDVHSVQSSTLDGILKLTLQSKFRGAAVAPARMIKQALWKIAGKTS